MKRSTISQSNSHIIIPCERLVVAGGTQGIGEGIAYRFAKSGAEVWIIGRNELKGNAVVERLREISQEHKVEPAPKHYFIKADLSLVSEAKRVVESVRTRAGREGVDYLVMTQGGPPNGTFTLTSESHDQHFAVQVLSRFVLAHELASDPASSTIKKGVMSIMAPGKALQAVDCDDIEMLQANEQGKYGIVAAASRDTIVVDAFTEEFAQRNPHVNFTHVSPGFVKSDVMRNSDMAWYIIAFVSVLYAFVSSSPESYAEVPFYLLANPEGRLFAAKERFSNENVVRLESHEAARDERARGKIWDQLVGIMKSNKSRL